MLTINRLTPDFDFSYHHTEDTGQHSVYVGRRSSIIIGPRVWHGIEIKSRNGLAYKWLRPGVYQAMFANMSNGRPAIRFLDDGWDQDNYDSVATLESLQAGRFYLHGIEAAELKPHHLAGCVGTGILVTPQGVSDPMRAFGGIRDALGGWNLFRKFQIEIVGGF